MHELRQHLRRFTTAKMEFVNCGKVVSAQLLDIFAGAPQQPHNFVFQFSTCVVISNLPFDVHGLGCANLSSL